MQLAAISGAEEAWCDKLRREVYEGLDVELAAVPAPAPHVDLPKPSESTIPARSSTGVRYPDLVREPSPAEPLPIPPIPPDLAGSLSRDAVQLFFNEMGTSMEGRDPDEWWMHGLPWYVNRLTCQLADAQEKLAFAQEDFNTHKNLTAAISRSHDAITSTQEQLVRDVEQQNDELRKELELAQAKVEVLSEVLSRKNA